MSGQWIKCYKRDCRADIWLVQAFYDTLQRQRENGEFFCPYGHRQHFVSGPTVEDELRRERNRLAQQIAERDDEIRRQRDLRTATERQLYAAKGRITKIKNRVGHGVCPCCNRTFQDLQRHMHSKHPAYPKTEALEAAE